ncbi:MAG TPA: response regulator [Bacteroidales bacterium]|jgi:CheY-like chemotaxis protein|nr:response regulator [Bacteroidales bacterium]
MYEEEILNGKGEPLVILFIEDDPAHAEITMRNFKKNRISNKVIHLWDGQEALDYLFRQGKYSDPDTSPTPHLILLDLRLPKVDGLEVLERIRAVDKLKCIPTVVLTTSQAEADISKAYQYNVNSYLVKPMDYEKFSNLIEAFGFYWAVWNKYPPCN